MQLTYAFYTNLQFFSIRRPNVISRNAKLILIHRRHHHHHHRRQQQRHHHHHHHRIRTSLSYLHISFNTVAMFSWVQFQRRNKFPVLCPPAPFRFPFQFLHVTRHLVKSTRRSLPISQPKYRSSQKTKQGFQKRQPEVKALSIQTTPRLLKLTAQKV